jgi:hypothetical protein
MEIERKDIFDLYVNERGNMALFGAANSGKTVFCQQIEKLVEHAIYINITENVYSENDLAEKIYATLYSNFGLPSKSTDFVSAESFGELIAGVNDERYFFGDTVYAIGVQHKKYQHALELVDKLAIKFDKNILFIIENIADFNQLYTVVAEANEAFELTCKIFKQYERVLFIFTGKSEKFCKLFTLNKSSLCRFAKIVDMPTITYSEYEKYINRWGITDKKIIQKIVETCEYNPQFINEILRELLIYRIISDSDITVDDDIKSAVDKVYFNNIAFLNLRLKNIRGKKYLSTILGLIAQNKNPYEFKETIKSTINRCLSVLLDEGLIFAPNDMKKTYDKEHRKKTYEISDPLLKRHILHLFGGM